VIDRFFFLLEIYKKCKIIQLTLKLNLMYN